MDKYQRAEKPKTKPESPISENEIRVTTQGLIRNYISYATTLLQEKNAREVVLKAMGQAISKTVAIAEIIKKRIPRLHQDIVISSVSITDVWEPIEEGLETLETTRQVSMISITLSTKELDKNSPGYQAPTNIEQPKQQYYYQQQSQPRQMRGYNAGGYEDSYGRGRGRGGGRGRGRGRGQSWGRGGYGSYQDNGGYSNWGRGSGSYQDNGGYSNWGRGGRSYQDNGGYSNWGRGGGRGGRGGGYSNLGYQGAGYERGRGGRGYGRGRGRMGGRSRGGGDGNQV